MKRCLADRWDVNVILERTEQSTKLRIWSFVAVWKQSVVFFLQGFKLRLSVLERVGVFMYIQTMQFVRCGSVLLRYLPDRNNVIPESKQEEAQSSRLR